LQLALMYEEAGDHAPAVGRYRQAVKVQPDNVVALNNLAIDIPKPHRDCYPAPACCTSTTCADCRG
jgi:hypothetical protein